MHTMKSWCCWSENYLLNFFIVLIITEWPHSPFLQPCWQHGCGQCKELLVIRSLIFIGADWEPQALKAGNCNLLYRWPPSTYIIPNNFLPNITIHAKNWRKTTLFTSISSAELGHDCESRKVLFWTFQFVVKLQVRIKIFRRLARNYESWCYIMSRSEREKNVMHLGDSLNCYPH